MKQVWKRPITGYGPASSKHILRDHSLYTHNLILNVTLSTGIVGGLMTLLMLLSRLLASFRRPHPMADAIVMFVIVNGMVENLIFSILTGLPTLIWIVALVWWSFDDDPAVNNLEGESV